LCTEFLFADDTTTFSDLFTDRVNEKAAIRALAVTEPGARFYVTGALIPGINLMAEHVSDPPYVEDGVNKQLAMQVEQSIPGGNIEVHGLTLGLFLRSCMDMTYWSWRPQEYAVCWMLHLEDTQDGEVLVDGGQQMVVPISQLHDRTDLFHIVDVNAWVAGAAPDSIECAVSEFNTSGLLNVIAIHTLGRCKV
jgi:hypothetical protein